MYVWNVVYLLIMLNPREDSKGAGVGAGSTPTPRRELLGDGKTFRQCHVVPSSETRGNCLCYLRLACGCVARDLVVVYHRVVYWQGCINTDMDGS